MGNYVKKPKILTSQGFSLIELMVVISIVSFLTTMAYPKYVSFRIKVARVEAKQNLNFVYTALQSYQAEASTYGYSAFDAGKMEGDTSSCSSSNVFGIAFTNCQKLRYYYLITPSGSSFEALALNEYAILTNGTLGVAIGAEPPISLSSCTSTFGISHHYVDAWRITQNKDMRVDPLGDATKLCL